MPPFRREQIFIGSRGHFIAKMGFEWYNQCWKFIGSFGGRDKRMAAHHHKKRDAFYGARPENIRRRKIVSVLTLIGIAIAFFLIAYFVGRPLVRQFRESPETFRAYVKSHRAVGWLTMIGIMAMQVVVAVIPGEPFELGAGFVFGWFQGSVLCLAGTALASSLVYLAVRKWGVQVVELFFPREKITRYSFMQNEKKLDLLVFMLFLIPGTPKDMLTYLVGLTPMRLGKFLWITLLARVPSVVSSAVTGALAQRGNYTAALVTYAVTLAISVVCILRYRRLSKLEKAQQAQPENEPSPKEEETHV